MCVYAIAASDSKARDARRNRAGGGTGTAHAPGSPGTLMVRVRVWVRAWARVRVRVPARHAPP